MQENVASQLEVSENKDVIYFPMQANWPNELYPREWQIGRLPD
jgi:hypothetical protein